MKRALLAVSLAVLLAACAAPTVPTTRGGGVRVTLADLVRDPASYHAKRVAFSASLDRVEETPQGIWIHVSDGDAKLPLYVRLSFGGAVRAMLGSGRMEFEVEIGERKLTPLGQTALEITPYMISQTRYFDQPIPLETPVDESH